IRDLVYPADCERLLDFGRRRELGEKAPIRYTFRISSRDGTPVALAASVSVARPGNDTLITTIVRETVLEKSLDIDQMTLAGWNRLASREREVITLLLEGQRPKEIALLLDISEKTVATHRRRALVKLNVEDDFTLFRFAVRHGLLQI
ncbi:MAG TPA: LuxR C-terminal-related transcriptional regulator, partial [Thermoanaerobaculia bacterium]